MRRSLPLLCLGLLLLASCSAPFLNLPVPAPTCYPMPQATGEKYIGPTPEATPPARVRPGDTLSLGFSGAYFIANNAILCAGTVTGYTHSDNLPGFTWGVRTVEVKLDDRVISTTRCAYACRVQVTVPGDVTVGTHQIAFGVPWKFLEFRIQVSP